jgi:ribulose-phosphate 3-epimerase
LSIATWKGIIGAMVKTTLFAPSILAADFTRLGEEIEQVVAGGADWLHVDVMDGHFVPNISMGPLVVDACRSVTDLPLDVHLMIEQPERYLRTFAKAGASGLTVHVETCPHLQQTLATISDLGLKSGVALNPGTPVSHLVEVIDMVDLILIMTVNPGFGGQKLIPKTLEKVQQLRKLLDERSNERCLIEVDGGINADTIGIALSAGANIFVAGNSVFGHPHGAREGLEALQQAINVLVRD